MAGFSTPNARSQQPAKQMSSRLLNMKFMQRSAASTPTAGTTQTPSTEPASKRRRIESSTASSPAPSAPATPSSTPSATNATHAGAVTVTRGGISTFSRGDGADTEWVLDLKMAFPGGANSKSNGQVTAQSNGATGSRFSSIHGLNGEDSDEEDIEGGDEDEDIWANQPCGRQTYGSFKQKGKPRTTHATPSEHNDADLSSASEDSDGDSEADPADHDHSHRRTPSRKRPKKASKNVDSDEEMRQVRRAIEQKHRNMAGTPITAGGRGQKRGREDGNYKSRKKSRKTI
ncbi:hypothetical protein A1O1_01781 [Capronia coronata CBS 617.96]|uniref:Uncharacterized protein n=1 Tax=Capronia coronata CBS 617.96 TaxID=1182541 RepID=W9ZFX8_9EURO|nr:uncharacterized protein A1O1_01781 [Capronia coronata CBS 617.96]EXJ93389.1 hypothetical protein A1O1_01781 [Capronia coronata CBS 617.96]